MAEPSDEERGAVRAMAKAIVAGGGEQTERLQLAQEVVSLEQERNGAGFLLRAAARMDAAEMRAFRAWHLAGRDKVVELALEIGRHWRDQEGVNGELLDRLEELTRNT